MDETITKGPIPAPNVPSGYVQISSWSEVNSNYWKNDWTLGYPIQNVAEQFNSALIKQYTGERKLEVFSMAQSLLKETVSKVNEDKSLYPHILYFVVHIVSTHPKDIIKQVEEMLASSGGEIRFRWYDNGDFGTTVHELGVSPTVN